RDQDLESLAAGEIHDDARVVRVVLHNKEDGIAGLDLESIVGKLLHRAVGTLRGKYRRLRRELMSLTRSLHDGGGADRPDRQIEGEGAACAGCAAQLDFAAKQVGKLGADGKAETGAAVLATGGSVGLLEGFEDDLLFLERNPDAAVGHFECDHSRRGAEKRML